MAYDFLNWELSDLTTACVFVLTEGWSVKDYLLWCLYNDCHCAEFTSNLSTSLELLRLPHRFHQRTSIHLYPKPRRNFRWKNNDDNADKNKNRKNKLKIKSKIVSSCIIQGVPQI